MASLMGDVGRINNLLNSKIDESIRNSRDMVAEARRQIDVKITTFETKITGVVQLLEQLNPERVLERGYALISGKLEVGNVVNITTEKQELEAEIKAIKQRS